MTAYQKVQEYRRAVGKKLQTLKAGQEELQQQAERVDREMTTVAGLLSVDKKKSGELQTFRVELAAIEDQIQAIEAAGGLSGILQQDSRMNELAEAAYSENIEALNGLRQESTDIAAEIRQQLEHFAELEARANRHAAVVKSLETEIDELKPFISSVSLPLKGSYRHKGADLPRPYNYVFSDIRKALGNLERERV